MAKKKRAPDLPVRALVTAFAPGERRRHYPE